MVLRFPKKKTGKVFIGMPPYHSNVPHHGSRFIGNLPLLPLRVTSKGTSARGPAPIPANPDEPDIVDEALDLFKANILFTTFEVSMTGGGALWTNKTWHSLLHPLPAD